MGKTVIGAFVSDSHMAPQETTSLDATRKSWIGGYPSITVHTGEDTFRLPWDASGPVPRVGANVKLTIEWEDE